MTPAASDLALGRTCWWPAEYLWLAWCLWKNPCSWLLLGVWAERGELGEGPAGTDARCLYPSGDGLDMMV